MIKCKLKPVWMFTMGLILGIAARLLDIYTTNLGNIFSEMSIWILLGVLIAIFSSTKKQAAVNVLLFSLGMIITYYLMARITEGVYSETFIYGWSIFALTSPLLGYFTWMTKENGIFPKIISVGIIIVTLGISIIIFDGPRIYDIVIVALLIYLLFIRKIKR